MRNYKLNEELYKADVEILDRYQAFSKELTRISLICIGIMGFLLKKIIFDPPTNNICLVDNFHKLSSMLYGSLFYLIISTACSIFHLYFSSDSLTHIISICRFTENKKYDKAEKEKSLRDFDFKFCSFLLLTSCSTLIFGVLLGAFFYFYFIP
ncbi:hypothetical protein [Chryseobacterium caseinilyticum]|uniref:hypothetical protein n=1 Tax=Chryseobacterium caseinilyticum TaxID=2771428 RepID=UPI001782282C|nr:hypothetical protein [Chryseobacterium caseinilyticum]